MVGVLAGKDPLLGILAGALGLLLGSVGAAPAVPHYRYTGVILYLFDGVPLPVLALGLFALPEILDLLVARRSIASTPMLRGGLLDGVRDVIRHRWLCFRCAVIGVAVGFIPGLGGGVVD